MANSGTLSRPDRRDLPWLLLCSFVQHLPVAGVADLPITVLMCATLFFGEKEPEACFCKIKEMALACGELHPMQQASARVLPLPGVSENSLEHEAQVLPSFLCSLGDSCLFQGVLVGEAFPHLAQWRQLLSAVERLHQPGKGKLPGREFTAAAFRAESELLLMVFEGRRALALKP